MKKVTIQTDNGLEFIGAVHKKGESAFQVVLHGFGVRHCRIPPRACTWQSDVEAFHKVIEDEFYDIEGYRDVNEFMGKSYAYELYFNFKRKTRHRGRQIPVEILKDSGDNTCPHVFNLPPVILDHYAYNFITGGYDVGLSTSD
ncbi:MAG: hypothetical protein ONB25_12570 [candidate division KSB1 bacterium]|nr:hypothetical protein [candidate division KSB1 bacterium]